MKRCAAALLAAGLILVALPPAAETQDRKYRHEHCAYREAGPPGPRGNRLFVFGESTLGLYRRGEQIRVAYYGPRCTGRQATIWNTDLIVAHLVGQGEGAFVSEHGGRFARPATRKRPGRQIEMRIFTWRLDYLGAKGRDHIVAGMTRDGHVGLDTDPVADGRGRDYDLVLPLRLPRLLRIYGGDGRDLIDARRLRRMGDRRERHKLWLMGEHQRDTLLGSPGAEERIEDGAGDDLVRAGGGDDEVWMGLGHDLVFGGGGADDIYYSVHERFGGAPPDVSDRIYGGPGDDVLADGNRTSDLLDCGPGFDEAHREKHDRPRPDCEKQPR